MENDLENSEPSMDEAPKSEKRKKLNVPWRSLALYFLPALVVFIIFFLMHKNIVEPPLTREEISALIDKKNEEDKSTQIVTDEETGLADTKVEEKLPQGSDIPLIGPQHYYHSFTGALATDLKNNSGILTIEIAVSIYMGKLNAEAYFENFKNFEPALRSVILALMRTKTKNQLDTTEGKDALKLEILETINNELVNLGSKPEVKSVQFTKLLLI